MTRFITLSPATRPSMKIHVNVDAIDAVDCVRWGDGNNAFVFVRGWAESGVEVAESPGEVMSMIKGDE